MKYYFAYAGLWLMTIQSLYGQIVNIEEKRILSDSNGFRGAISLAINYNKTTSKLLQGNAQTTLAYVLNKNRWMFFGYINQVSADAKDYLNNAYAHIRYNRLLNSWLVLESFVQYQYDKQKKILYRFLGGTGLRAELLKEENYLLSTGFTPMLEKEILLDNTEEQAFRLSTYLSFYFKIKPFFTFRHITYFQPRLDDFEDYRISSENMLEFLITRNFSFQFSTYLQYDTTPAPDVPDLFLSTSSGILIKF